MTDFANLPADITPGAFFKAVESALASEAAPAGASPEKLVIHIDGDAGGSWSMGFKDGKLAIDEGGTANAPLQVSATTGDFRAFIAGEIRDAIKAKSGGKGQIDAKQMAKLFKVTHKTDSVKAFSGDLQLRMEDGPKSYKLTLTFGGGSPNPAAPKTTVTMELSDFLALTAGELNAQAAFFAGKIRLDGDMNLAMGLMALAM